MVPTCAFCEKRLTSKRQLKTWPSNQYCSEKHKAAHAEAVLAGEGSIWDILFQAGVALGAKLHEDWRRRRQAGDLGSFRTAPADMRSVCLQALGLDDGATLAEAEKQYRVLARKHHPDKPGGSQDKMRDLNIAIAKLRELDRATA